MADNKRQNKSALTIKQEKYVQGLFAGLSQREAYKQAYNCENMTDKSVDEVACVLANDLKIKSRLNELQEQFTKTSMVTKEYVISKLVDVAERCSSGKRLDATGTNKALELLGKHLKLFTDKVESNNTNENHNYDESHYDKLFDALTPDEQEIAEKFYAMMKDAEARIKQ